MMTTHNRLALPPSLYADTAVPPVPAPPIQSGQFVGVRAGGGVGAGGSDDVVGKGNSSQMLIGGSATRALALTAMSRKEM